jgi:membrane-associated phospholipid phosphatase
MFSVNLQAGLFFATALSLNWALGAGSYFLLPSIGPFHADPATFAALPATEVGHLQQVLIDQRAAFLADPSVPGSAQSIGAFASLHVSIYATAALAAHLLGFRRAWKAALWILTAATAVSTIYFGWHYVLDDLGGVVIAAISLALARVVTGVDLRTARRARHPQGAAARRTTGTATA